MFVRLFDKTFLIDPQTEPKNHFCVKLIINDYMRLRHDLIDGEYIFRELRNRMKDALQQSFIDGEYHDYHIQYLIIPSNGADILLQDYANYMGLSYGGYQTLYDYSNLITCTCEETFYFAANPIKAILPSEDQYRYKSPTYIDSEMLLSEFLINHMDIELARKKYLHFYFSELYTLIINTVVDRYMIGLDSPDILKFWENKPFTAQTKDDIAYHKNEILEGLSQLEVDTSIFYLPLKEYARQSTSFGYILENRYRYNFLLRNYLISSKFDILSHPRMAKYLS